MTYIPAFDGLRALAALLVVAFHAKLDFAGAGFLGVDMFFVLSGFLITSILKAPGRESDCIGFVTRRLERLYPALLLFLLAMAVALPLFQGGGAVWGEILPAALYIANYARLLTGEPDVLRHTWSLAVEFQFYLVWPFCIALLVRMTPQRALAVLVLLYLSLSAWRVVAYAEHGWAWTYTATDTRIGGMVLGGVIAFLPRVEMRVGCVMELLGVGLLVIALVNGVFYVPDTAFFYAPMAEIGCALVIFSLASGRTVFAPVLGLRVLRKLGHWSYGIYLWHYPVAFALRETVAPGLTFAVALGVSVVMAALSYEFLEVRIRDALRARRRRQVPVLD